MNNDIWFMQEAKKTGYVMGLRRHLIDEGLMVSERFVEKKSYGTASGIKSTLTDAGEQYLEKFFADRVSCGVTCQNHDGKFESSGACKWCGGKNIDGEIIKTCKGCGKETDSLFGLFIPSLCKPCADKRRESDEKSGRICKMCKSTYSECCC